MSLDYAVNTKIETVAAVSAHHKDADWHEIWFKSGFDGWFIVVTEYADYTQIVRSVPADMVPTEVMSVFLQLDI